MPYTPTTWADGNLVTPALLNKIETGLVAVSAVGETFSGTAGGVVDNTTALTAAAGRTIFFPPGTYRLTSSSVMSLTANTKWYAVPGTVTISFDGTATEIFRTAGNDVVIEGINFVRAANTATLFFDLRGGFDRFTMRQCTINGSRDLFGNSCSAFKVGESSGFDTIHVYDTTVTKCSYGLLMSNAATATVTDILFDGCYFTNQYATDLEFNSPNGTISDVVVRSCVFKDNQATASGSGWAVGFAHVSRAAVRDCTITNYYREGLHIEDLSQSISIEGNRLVQCAKNDFSYIELTSNSTDVRIANNTLDARANNNGTAIPAISVHFTAGTTPGGRTAASPERVTITGNTILASTVNTASVRGIYLEDSIDVTATGNILVGTGVVSAGAYTGTQESAFMVLGGKDIVLSNNIVKGWLNGLRPTTLAPFGAHGGMVTNNVFRDCSIAISILNTGAAVVSGNMMYNCIKPLLAGNSTSTGAFPAVITGNHAYSCVEPMAFTGISKIVVPSGATTVTTGAGRTVSVKSLDHHLPNATVVTFSGGGTLTLTSAADAQATSLLGTVAVASITANEVAYVPVSYSTVGGQNKYLLDGNAESVTGGVGYQFNEYITAQSYPLYKSGNYYFCNSPANSGTSNTLANGTLRLTPFPVTEPLVITRIGAEFTAAGDAASVFRIGIYADDGTGLPGGAAVLDAGSISTGTGNAGTVATGGTPGSYEVTLTAQVLLQPGMYWVGGVVQGVTVTQPTLRTVGSSSITFPTPSATIPGTAAAQIGFQLTGATGALGTWSGAVGAGTAPRIFFKAG